MSVKHLLDPVLDQGIRHTNFFEGRLLTGEDLRNQQDANREHDRRLGRAIGPGIMEGLDVELISDGSDGTAPTVSVSKGLAINRNGDIFGLPDNDITLALSRTIEPPKFELADFYACAGPPGVQHLPSGVGMYILVMSPMAGYKERAPKSGLGDAGIAKGCGSKYIQEGVEFRLVNISKSMLVNLSGLSASLVSLLDDDLLNDFSPALQDDISRVSQLRNVLAAVFFGLKLGSTNSTRLFVEDGETPQIRASAVYDQLYSQKLMNNCDVPLALCYWTLSGVAFVDMWITRDLTVVRTAEDYISKPVILGVNRLIQFSDHIHWLRLKNVDIQSNHITDYFRFTPPGILLPVKLPGVTSGFRIANFLENLFIGGPTKVSSAQGLKLVWESLLHDYVDLNMPVTYQLYEFKDNLLMSSAVSQSYYLCLSRELYDAKTTDEVAKVIDACWNVYRGLIRRQVFLPPATDEAKIAARMTIAEAVRDVMAIANRYSSLAAGTFLDVTGALQAFSVLYDIQFAMVTLFTESIPGIDDTQERELFASVINQYLNNSLPGGKPALKTAIDDGSLIGAVNAQTEINRFVGSWSGEGVAVGPFYFTYSESPEGVDLVPGADAIPQVFTLVNGTNRNLTMNLTAEVFAASGNWLNRTTILGSIGGAEIDSVTLATGAERQIVMMVSAPPDAIVGEPVTLVLTASVGPPTSRESVYTNESLLWVSEASGGPVIGQVQISGHRFNPLSLDPSNIPPQLIFGLLVSIVYEAGDGVSRDFELLLTPQAGDDSLWSFMDEATGTELEQLPGGAYKLDVLAVTADGSPNAGWVRIQAPSRSPTGDRSITLALSVQSKDLDPAITADYDTPINLVVRSG